jgi:opacity protein-like surface antigen
MILNTIKQALLICLILQIGSAFFSSSAFAQKQRVTTSEIGAGIGGANYKGELAPSYRFLNNQPALTIFYRRDISAPLTVRAAFMGSHRIFDHKAFRDQSQNLPYHDWRDMDLKLSLAEFSLAMEYNFLDYYADVRQPHRISPYFFAGVALLNYNHQLSSNGDILKPFDNKFTVSIPFGVGVKYALSRHWNLGLEFGARKMFNDIIDHLNEDDGKALANPFNKDMYFYNGISLSYTIYRINCPPVYKRKAGVLD